MLHDHLRNAPEPKGFWSSRYAIGLLVMSTAAMYFLLTEHRAHFFGALPFLILLACPLMHVFMHHGNEGHGGRGSSRDVNKPVTPPAPITGKSHD